MNLSWDLSSKLKDRHEKLTSIVWIWCLICRIVIGTDRAYKILLTIWVAIVGEALFLALFQSYK